MKGCNKPIASLSSTRKIGSLRLFTTNPNALRAKFERQKYRVAVIAL